MSAIILQEKMTGHQSGTPPNRKESHFLALNSSYRSIIDPSINYSEAGFHVAQSRGEQQEEKKFLPIPSLGAGLCLGLNNFLLGLIAD